MAWQLTSSPDAPEFLDRLDDWQLCPDPAKKLAKGRAFAEDDYYAYLKYFSTFGRFRIAEPGHPRNGGLWVDEQLVFEIVRQFQLDYETATDNVWWNLPRFHFKSEILNKNAAIWGTLRAPQKTTLILTYKVDTVGIKMFSGITRELEQNVLLQEHWPDVVTHDPRNLCPTWTRTQLTVLRQPGPNDPSIQIASIKKAPTSGHFDTIIVDDFEVAETVQSVEEIEAAVEDVEDITALQSFDTRKWFIGTIWDGDGPQMKLYNRGYFSRRQGPWSCYGTDGEPVLHSKKFLRKWRREYGKYKFSCQMLGTPEAKGDQYFHLEQLHRYHNSPVDERRGKNVIAIVDPAKGKSATGQKRDFSCIFVYGLGRDRKIYLLDMWIERLSMIEAGDMLFGPQADEEGRIQESRKWMPRQGLIKRWGIKTVYVEDFAVTGWHQYLSNERERRMDRSARFVALPPQGWQFWPKENRIAALQPMYENEEILHPADGIGHATQHEPTVDVHQQFVERYLTKWINGEKGGGLLHDDPLDTESWLSQPEVKRLLRYPVAGQGEEETSEEERWRKNYHKQQNVLTPAESFWTR